MIDCSGFNHFPFHIQPRDTFIFIRYPTNRAMTWEFDTSESIESYYNVVPARYAALRSRKEVRGTWYCKSERETRGAMGDFKAHRSLVLQSKRRVAKLHVCS